MIKYIELKSGYSDNGPAWVSNVKASKSGQTIYFNGRALSKRNGISGNYVDLESREEYWISNVKQRGGDRHWAGNGKILIASDSIEEYLEIVGGKELDVSKFEVTDEIQDTDITKFHELQNEKL